MLTINFDAEFNLAGSSSLDVILKNTFDKIELKLVTKQEAAYQQSIVKVSEVVHKFSEAISQDCSKFSRRPYVDNILEHVRMNKVELYESMAKVSKVLVPK